MNPQSPDIRSHFGLVTLPFTREITVEKRFMHPQYETAREALLQTILDRMCALLVAPDGTGKTMLLRTLKSSLPEARFRTQYIKVTSLSKRDMCREIATVVGCEPVGQYNTLVNRIQKRLLDSCDLDGLRPVLIIDEAHDMRPDVLATLRVLTNFQMDSRLVVSIILCGQTPLAKLLRRDELASVSRRMAHMATLRNLGRDESRKYVAHRLTIVGARQDLFDDSAHDALFEIARGNLRALDRLALKSLQLAAKDGTDVVEAPLVAAARESLWI